jgi:hypothetical protein
MNLQYTILLYIILISLIYFWKPHIFQITEENKKKKMYYLIFLVVIISIISFYIKVLYEWFF